LHLSPSSARVHRISIATMLRQLVSRAVLGRTSSLVSGSVLPSSSSCSNSNCYASVQSCHAYSYLAVRSFSSSSNDKHSSSASSSSSSSVSSSSSSSTSSPSEVPPNFYQDIYGENLSMLSEEVTFTGHPKYIIPGPFGTMEKPAIIYSEFESRIVGCEGGDGLPHHLQWFVLRKGKKNVCQDCGQVFWLQFAPDENEGSIRAWIGDPPVEHHDDDHGKEDEHGGHGKSGY